MFLLYFLRNTSQYDLTEPSNMVRVGYGCYAFTYLA